MRPSFFGTERRRHGLFDGGVVIPAVDNVEIDIVSVEALEAFVDFAYDGFAPVHLSNVVLTLILGGLQTVMPISTDLYLPGLPTIACDLKVSPGAAQFTLAVFLIGVAIGQVAYDPITDKYGRQKPLRFGLAVYTLGSIICALAPTINLLIGGRFLQALGSAASPGSACSLGFLTVRR